MVPYTHYFLVWINGVFQDKFLIFDLTFLFAVLALTFEISIKILTELSYDQYLNSMLLNKKCVSRRLRQSLWEIKV